MRGGKEKRKTEAVAEERQQVQQSQRRSSSDVVSIITLSLTAAAEAAAATPVKWVGVDLGGWQGQRQWTTLPLTLPSSFPSRPTELLSLHSTLSLFLSRSVAAERARHIGESISIAVAVFSFGFNVASAARVANP